MNVVHDTKEDNIAAEEDLAAIGTFVIRDESRTNSTRTKASSEILLEFLEIAIQQILYVKKIYPVESFVKRKKYNIPIHVSAHPGLNEYISKTLHSLTEFVEQGRISQICVLLKEGQIPVENFVFEMKLLEAENQDVEDFVKLEQSLRSVLLGILSNSAITSVASSRGITFEILAGCSSDCEVELNSTDPTAMKWLILDAADLQKSQKPEQIVPIKAITESPIFNMQLIVKQVM